MSFVYISYILQVSEGACKERLDWYKNDSGFWLIHLEVWCCYSVKEGTLEEDITWVEDPEFQCWVNWIWTGFETVCRVNWSYLWVFYYREIAIISFSFFYLQEQQIFTKYIIKAGITLKVEKVIRWKHEKLKVFKTSNIHCEIIFYLDLISL